MCWTSSESRGPENLHMTRYSHMQKRFALEIRTFSICLEGSSKITFSIANSVGIGLLAMPLASAICAYNYPLEPIVSLDTTHLTATKTVEMSWSYQNGTGRWSRPFYFVVIAEWATNVISLISIPYLLKLIIRFKIINKNIVNFIMSPFYSSIWWPNNLNTMMRWATHVLTRAPYWNKQAHSLLFPPSR